MTNFLDKYSDLLDLVEDSSSLGININDRDLQLFVNDEYKQLEEQCSKLQIDNFKEELSDISIGFEKVNCAWEYITDKNEFNGGEFSVFHPIWSYINIPFPEYLIINSPCKERKIFILDEHPYIGDGIKVVCCFASQNFSDRQLYLVDPNGRFFKLDLDIKSYLEWTLLIKGFYNWQYLFAPDCPEDEKQYLKDNYFDRMVVDLPRLFPSDDYSELKRKCDAFL